MMPPRPRGAAAFSKGIGLEDKSGMNDLSHKFCVAPLMECTDTHCRVLHRALSRNDLLYTEMVTA